MKTISILLLISISIISTLHSQIESEIDAFKIKDIYTETLENNRAYKWLGELCSHGHRQSGSHTANRAQDYLLSLMSTMKFDTLYTQECEVAFWDRGIMPEEVSILSADNRRISLDCIALGNSVGTDARTLSADVVEVHSLDEVDELGESLRSKIVFYNRPMDPTKIRTFSAYGGAVDQRVFGADRAAKYGAVAVLVRSMTTSHDDVPHTGVNIYNEGTNPIPAIAISTNSANLLSNTLKLNPKLKVELKADCKQMENRTSYNLIGEIKGSENPEDIILVGGHVDSWDVGTGAHDDGAGCAHSLDAIATLIAIGYKPKKTWRCVLFANEENGLKGGLKYAEISNNNEEYHLAAIESDAGGFTPRGFSFTATDSVYKELIANIEAFSDLLEPYGLSFNVGGAGADINPLKSQNGLLFGFRPDSQRYFDYHHTQEDTFDKVNMRELQLGVGAIASLVYLIDKYGLHP